MSWYQFVSCQKILLILQNSYSFYPLYLLAALYHFEQCYKSLTGLILYGNTGFRVLHQCDGVQQYCCSVTATSEAHSVLKHTPMYKHGGNIQHSKFLIPPHQPSIHLKDFHRKSSFVDTQLKLLIA